jgi:hypothetical protein
MTIFAILFIYNAHFSSFMDWRIMLGLHLVLATLHMRFTISVWVRQVQLVTQDALNSVVALSKIQMTAKVILIWHILIWLGYGLGICRVNHQSGYDTCCLKAWSNKLMTYSCYHFLGYRNHEYVWNKGFTSGSICCYLTLRLASNIRKIGCSLDSGDL